VWLGELLARLLVEAGAFSLHCKTVQKGWIPVGSVVLWHTFRRAGNPAVAFPLPVSMVILKLEPIWRSDMMLNGPIKPCGAPLPSAFCTPLQSNSAPTNFC